MQRKSIAIFLTVALCGSLVHAQNKSAQKPPPPPPPPPKVEVVKFKPPVIVTGEMEDFYDRNPEVDKINWRTPQQVVISFKDKERKNEEYDLSDETIEQEFQKKYGEVPKAPPPPPPPKRKVQ